MGNSNVKQDSSKLVEKQEVRIEGGESAARGGKELKIMEDKKPSSDEKPPSDEKAKEEKPKEVQLEKAEGSAQLDFTKLPGILNNNFDKLDTDAALHATILKTGDSWTRKFQKGLLATPTEEQLEREKQGKEKNKVFDLLDALSRSGTLQIDCASFHVVV